MLFGIMALQNDFISRDGLIEEMAAWVLDKSQTLGAILKARGVLVEDEYQLLEALMRKHLEKHSDDVEKSLAAVSSIKSVRQELQSLADSDVAANLVHVAAAPQAEDPGGHHLGKFGKESGITPKRMKAIP
jgi:eukaryotic-like serine/threonine-protein kinase